LEKYVFVIHLMRSIVPRYDSVVACFSSDLLQEFLQQSWHVAFKRGTISPEPDFKLTLTVEKSWNSLVILKN